MPHKLTTRLLFVVFVVSSFAETPIVCGAELVTLRGRIVDAATCEVIAARLYIQDEAGKFFHANSAASVGSAVDYHVQRSPQSIETHTTLSAHPFTADLAPGKYTVTAERGKEYQTASVTVELTTDSAEFEVPLKRWIDMSSHGWYSGETHVHRSMEDLPNVILAEDLNVALPLTHWVTRAYTPPTQGDKNSDATAAKLVEVDSTHVIYPLNTEYEIFTVAGKRHALGAIFALNQKSVLTQGAPPVRSIAEQVHREGGLLELDKHNWEWSMMLVPVMNVDLYELTNNHLWRTEFHFKNFGMEPAKYMHVAVDANGGLTEQGWLEFTFQNYYALLNCGFRMRPTAGTASGVHPVPLGFGRVYVHLPDGFSYDAWMKGLDAGRSFVTTGPMLVVTVDDQPVGSSFRLEGSSSKRFRIQGWAKSQHPLARIEIVSSDGVIESIQPQNVKTASGAYSTTIDATVQPSSSTWVAVRCYEQLPNGRIRFAHTAPSHIDIAGKPLRPRKVEAEYLADRVRREIERHKGVLKEEAMAEFHEALQAYEKIAESAR